MNLFYEIHLLSHFTTISPDQDNWLKERLHYCVYYLSSEFNNLLREAAIMTHYLVTGGSGYALDFFNPRLLPENIEIEYITYINYYLDHYLRM